MKYIILSIVFITYLSYSYSQTLTFDDCRNIEIAAEYSNGDTLTSFILKDGSELKIGSLLKIGRPLEPTKFTRLVTGKYNLTKALFGPPLPAGPESIGKDKVISSIMVYHSKMSKKSPLTISLYLADPMLGEMAKYSTVFDIQVAIETGEIINPSAALTREQAISKLKEAKELLELGMMKQAEFDDLKEKLTPIIKQ